MHRLFFQNFGSETQSNVLFGSPTDEGRDRSVAKQNGNEQHERQKKRPKEAAKKFPNIGNFPLQSLPVRSNQAIQWEETLKSVFDAMDAELEAEYGMDYPLHPSRPKRGETANPEDDGLFNVGAAFSAGFGSKYGPGYVVEIRIATLSRVPEAVRAEIKEKIFQGLEKRLPAAFPGKNLRVTKENGVIRIYGDLSLDD